jgi:hypothetical protein
MSLFVRYGDATEVWLKYNAIFSRLCTYLESIESDAVKVSKSDGEDLENLKLRIDVALQRMESIKDKIPKM